MADVAKLMEEIKSMTVIELSNFVKALEEEFGVSAAAPVAAGAVAGAAEAAADGPLAARGRDGSRLHAGACVFPRGSAGDPARHHHRHDHGLHALAR